MIVALASPRIAATVDDGLARVEHLIAEAAAGGARIVCFPEAYLPGLRGQDFPVPDFGPADEARVIELTRGWALRHGITVILGLEHATPAGRQIAAAVVDRTGRLEGYQTKNQLDPSEEAFYVPGRTRRVFEADGVRFGIAICHEAFRYPETVRWAAARGAQIVFHPSLTGSDRVGRVPSRWTDPDAEYYEKAIMCRALENTIYLASVNYGVLRPEAATAVIDPSGRCVARLPYGAEGVLLYSLDLSLATGLLAGRYAPDRYQEESG
jgi:predicted amidohydrolase